MDWLASALLVLIFLMTIPTLALVAVIYSRLFTQSPIAPLLGAPRGFIKDPTGLSPTGLSPIGLSPTGLSPTGLSPTGIIEFVPQEYSSDNVVNTLEFEKVF
jgi:hypothetical protein